MKKLYYLTLFVIMIPVLITPVFALEINTDQDKYYLEENMGVYINGTIQEYLGKDLEVRVIDSQNNTIINTYPEIKSNAPHEFSVNLKVESWDIDIYTIIVEYYGISNSTTFNLIFDEIQFEVPLRYYYVDELILIEGFVSEIDWSRDTGINYELSYNDMVIHSGTNEILNNDGTFDFTISTDDIQLDGTGNLIDIVIFVQDYSASDGFYYNDSPNKENDTIYDMAKLNEERIISNNNTLAYHDSIMVQSNDIMYAQNNTITSLLNTISTLEESINILAAMVEELTSRVPPLPLDAPIIISVTADDPDNLDDIFSDSDTITILFDSETNEPLGDGTLTKQEVDDLFTFSEKIAQAYSGTWTNSSAFMISINSMANSQLIINSTTVTPAQTVPILPADNNQENYSHETSPVLTGDWGIPQ